MADFMTIDASAMRNIVRRVSAGKAPLVAPFSGGRGVEAVKIMRTGTKGVYRQFVDQTEYKGTTSTPWARTQDFGTRKAPRKTMLGTGLYRAAFLGGAGSIERIEPKSVEIGVDSGLFPQVKIHQSRRPYTIVKPKARTRGGKDFKMRFFLGLTYGVWMSRERIAKGMKIPRRRVSVSSDVRKAVAAMLRKEVGKGFKIPRLSTAAVR